MALRNKALLAASKLCTPQWEEDDQIMIVEYIADLLGDGAVADTRYAPSEYLFGRKRFGPYEEGKGVIGDRGKSIFFSYIEDSEECEGTPEEIIEDITAIYLVYHYLKKHPENRVNPQNLVECFSMAFFKRYPLAYPGFLIYYFPSNRDYYYVNCYERSLEILDVNKKNNFIFVETEDGQTSLRDDIYVPLYARRKELEVKNRDMDFESALDAFKL